MDKLVGIFHHFAHHAGGLFQFLFRAFQEQFVMHLEQQAGLQASFGQGIRQADHGNLDDIGGGALDGGVDGLAFLAGADAGLWAGSSGWGSSGGGRGGFPHIPAGQPGGGCRPGIP